MDDFVHIVSPTLKLAHDFARANQIPLDRARIYFRPEHLYGSKFGRFVYMIEGTPPVLEHETQFRAGASGTTIIRLNELVVVERTWR